MPLSEYEQRVLEQMERALTSDDPRLANTLQSTGRRSPLRFVMAGIGVVAGLLLLVFGAARGETFGTIVGAVGFILMFTGVTFAITGPRKPKQGTLGLVNPDGSVRSGPQAPAKSKGGGGYAGLLARLEERWDKRRGGQDGRG
ncbi:DUF3040 domain-containing protein [Antribacter gilvus]|uniref:DUF3040 domain-containing protein n=1 Tax=Antribacter gilvus TaxID=2304675 RepID=UPI000F7A3CFC|nr:DUF3040 domain-containing protein [Antribacter gilvus]